MHKDRPRYLNLLKIRLPVTGVVSILHRVSGVLLILSIPVCAFLLQRSLQDPTGYGEVINLLNDSPLKWFLALALWSVAHHLFAGLRFLLFDIDIGVQKSSARRAAWTVLFGDVIVLALMIGWLI